MENEGRVQNLLQHPLLPPSLRLRDMDVIVPQYSVHSWLPGQNLKSESKGVSIERLNTHGAESLRAFRVHVGSLSLPFSGLTTPGGAAHGYDLISASPHSTSAPPP